MATETEFRNDSRYVELDFGAFEIQLKNVPFRKLRSFRTATNHVFDVCNLVGIVSEVFNLRRSSSGPMFLRIGDTSLYITELNLAYSRVTFEEGSVKASVAIVFMATLGTYEFVANYSNFKQGFKEIENDLRVGVSKTLEIYQNLIKRYDHELSKHSGEDYLLLTGRKNPILRRDLIKYAGYDPSKLPLDFPLLDIGVAIIPRRIFEEKLAKAYRKSTD